MVTALLLAAQVVLAPAPAVSAPDSSGDVAPRVGVTSGPSWGPVAQPVGAVPRVVVPSTDTAQPVARKASDAATVARRRALFLVAGAVTGAVAAKTWVDRRVDRRLARTYGGLDRIALDLAATAVELFFAMPVGILGGAGAGYGLSFVVFPRRR